MLAHTRAAMACYLPKRVNAPIGAPRNRHGNRRAQDRRKRFFYHALNSPKSRLALPAVKAPTIVFEQKTRCHLACER
jgi:hypothetical protein